MGLRNLVGAGGALLAGLLRCRRCGKRLHVFYSGQRGKERQSKAARYLCKVNQTSYDEAKCLRFGGWVADRAIGREILRVLQPLALEAAVEAERQLDERQQRVRRAQEPELAQARYEAQLSERRYAACDPDNRLVASQLGANWEAAIRRVRAFEEIVVDIDEAGREVILVIHWKGGQHSELRLRTLRTGEHQMKTQEEATEVVRRMSGRWSESILPPR